MVERYLLVEKIFRIVNFLLVLVSLILVIEIFCYISYESIYEYEFICFQVYIIITLIIISMLMQKLYYNQINNIVYLSIMIKYNNIDTTTKEDLIKDCNFYLKYSTNNEKVDEINKILETLQPITEDE